MANVKIEQETAVRDDIKTLIESLGVFGTVFPRRRYIKSRQDFVKKLGKKTLDNRTEIRFVEIRFLGFEDSPTLGHDTNPAAILKYQIHVFFEFIDERSDGSNSDEDFTAAILDLRDKFLLTERFGIVNDTTGRKRGSRDPLTQDTFAQFGFDTLTDCEGHFVDLRLNVTHGAIC
jgi:hypothetical protein